MLTIRRFEDAVVGLFLEHAFMTLTLRSPATRRRRRTSRASVEEIVGAAKQTVGDVPAHA